MQKKHNKKKLEELLKNTIKYTNWLAFIIAVYATFYGLVNIKKIGFYSIFIVITTCAVIQQILMDFFSFNYNKEKSLELNNYTVNIYLVFELIILSFFFFKRINSNKYKKMIYSFNGMLILLLSISIFTSNDFITNHYSVLAAVEAFVMLINCIFLFIQILEDDKNALLKKSPDFLITAGIFFLFSFTCPFYMTYKYVNYNNPILYSCFYIVNAIGYFSFHLAIILAYKCKIHSIRL